MSSHSTSLYKNHSFPPDFRQPLETFESQREQGAAWIGTPDVIVRQITDYSRRVGGFEIASMQVNFNVGKREDAEASLRLFAAQVLPQFSSQ